MSGPSRALTLVLALFASACASTVPGRDPLGEVFPTVAGTTSNEGRVLVPDALTGEPAVLLFGYDGRSQFDQDRWVVGLRDLGVDVPLLQLAGSGGLVPSVDSRWLTQDLRDDLRRGESARWMRLETDAVRSLEVLFGNVDEQRARVVVLDADGRVAWFGDEGYSPSNAWAVAEALRGLGAPPRRERETRTAREAGSDRAAVLGTRFPDVSGESLAGTDVRLPEDLAGAPAVLLVGFEQEAQFDIDRWLVELVAAGVDARILEVPTIPGFLANLASGFIDSGMRSGIPPEDWAAVVCLYGGQAEPVAELLGTEDGHLARVVVLDEEGRVVGFHDGGYGHDALEDVTRLLERR